jgi:hypothetical protein
MRADKKSKWKGVFARNRKAKSNAGTHVQQDSPENPRSGVATPPGAASNTSLRGPDTIYGPDLSLIRPASATLSDADSMLSMGPPIIDHASSSGSINLEEDEHYLVKLLKRTFKGKKKKSEQSSVRAQSSEEDVSGPQFTTLAPPFTASASYDMTMGPPPIIPEPHLLNLVPGPFGAMVPSSVPLERTRNSGPSFTPTAPPLGPDSTTSDEFEDQTFDASPGNIAQKNEPNDVSAPLLEPKPSNSVTISHLMVCHPQWLLYMDTPYNPVPPSSQ